MPFAILVLFGVVMAGMTGPAVTAARTVSAVASTLAVGVARTSLGLVHTALVLEAFARAEVGVHAGHGGLLQGSTARFGGGNGGGSTDEEDGKDEGFHDVMVF